MALKYYGDWKKEILISEKHAINVSHNVSFYAHKFMQGRLAGGSVRV